MAGKYALQRRRDRHVRMLDMPAATVVIVPATMLVGRPHLTARAGRARRGRAPRRGWPGSPVSTPSQDGRIGLHGRVESQLVLGEPVQVVGSREDWRQVICPWQPSSADPRGYPGWVPAAHLGQARGRRRRRVGPAPDAQGRPARRCSRTARQHLGLPYLWGGMSTYGLDCSGLVHLSLRSAGAGRPPRRPRPAGRRDARPDRGRAGGRPAVLRPRRPAGPPCRHRDRGRPACCTPPRPAPSSWRSR